MHYNPLNQMSRIEKSNLLTNRIIVNALQSDRGDIIRAMNDADFKNMLASVFYVVHNKLAVETQLAYDYYLDKSAEFKPRTDVEIEEEVSAFFEIDGKLQYSDVEFESFIVLPLTDKPIKWVTRQMKMGKRGMRYNPYSLEDRLEKADILTDIEIMKALQDERVDVIREMSYVDLKRWRKDLCAGFYHELYAEVADNFEEARAEYDAKMDDIDAHDYTDDDWFDPDDDDQRKNFKPKTKFEIYQEIKAYFEEHETIH